MVFPWKLYYFFNFFFILFAIVLKDFWCCHVGRGTCVWITQQRPNRCQNSSYVVHWTPLVIKNIKTNISIIVYVGVKHSAFKDDLWRFVGIVFRKCYFEDESSPLPNCIYRPMYDCIPGVNVIGIGSSTDSGINLFLYFLQVLEKSSFCCCCHILNIWL